MARSATTYHGINKAGLSTDQYSFPDDYFNLIDRFENALRGVGAFAAGSNYVNSQANNAGKLLSAVGNAYRGRVIGVNAADDAGLIFQDNAGGTGTDKFILGYDDSLNAFGLSAGATLGNGLAVDTNGDVYTRGTDLGIRMQKIQCFQVGVRNNGGTIEHRITSPAAAGTAGNLVSKVTGASITYTATGQSTGAFTAGAVLLSGDNYVLILNTAAPTIADTAAVAAVVYNGTGTAVAVFAVISSRTVNGVLQNRLELQYTNAASGNTFALNTTNIPSGSDIRVQVLCTLL